MSSAPKNAVVLVLDRLSAAYLGPYGNTWLETPAWNRLAAESFVFDFAYSDGTKLSEAYQAYWRGVSHLAGPMGLGSPLPLALARCGIATRLLTDEPEMATEAGQAGFESVEVIQAEEDSTLADDEIGGTRLGQFFAAAIDALLEPTAGPSLLWLHARALSGPWDAPHEWRKQLCDEEDPEPPTFVDPPAFRVAGTPDPDMLFGLTRAYGAQVQLVDACCGALHEALLQSPHADSTLLIVTSPRGYPLGEHGSVGAEAPRLYGEQLHVPLLVRDPQERTRFGRSADLTQPADLYATLLAWWDSDPSAIPANSLNLWPHMLSDAALDRNCAIARAGLEQAVRTRDWFLRQPAEGPAELYRKPDDRFEVNELASRCPADVAQLTSLLPRD